MLEPTRGFRVQVGSLSESRHISSASTPKFKRTCNATVGLHGQTPDPLTMFRTKFWHLVVNTSETPYERSITKQPHSYITSQNRLQISGALTRTESGYECFQQKSQSASSPYAYANLQICQVYIHACQIM
ncbi:hypothetical protein M9H77_30858 [Catharanthus roseus]|uniref:Uncharacterized protein n=1 Tax=Catharanthus roseus TaxID=4058 RepID=A0ACC0A2C6_CATRO|nr:hypothetical protein M9H77_30858 [Catharanthus roseus]